MQRGESLESVKELHFGLVGVTGRPRRVYNNVGSGCDSSHPQTRIHCAIFTLAETQSWMNTLFEFYQANPSEDHYSSMG